MNRSAGDSVITDREHTCTYGNVAGSSVRVMNTHLHTSVRHWPVRSHGYSSTGSRRHGCDISAGMYLGQFLHIRQYLRTIEHNEPI